MKRDAAGKFIQNWRSETKQRVSLSLTDTAWRSLKQAAQQYKLSCSEVIERFARNLNSECSSHNGTETHLSNHRLETPIALLQKQVLEQQQTIATLQHQNQVLEARLEATSEAIAVQEASKIATILEKITDAFVAFDHNWRYTYVNQAAAQILRQTPTDLLGKHVWQDVFPELVGGIAYQELHRAVAEQVPVSWEEFGTSVQRWLEAHAYPSQEGIAVYFRDVTERKHIEHALRESEERLTLALTAAQMVSWDMDLQTNWVVCSSNGADIWGLQEGPGETFFATIHPDDRQRIIQAAQRAVDGETTYCQEYRILAPDGTIRWLNSQGRVYLDQNGRGVRMVGMSVDITERKAIEANQIRARQQIEQLLEELQRKERQQQFLIELNDLIRTLQDPHEMMWQVICATGQHFNVTRCTYGQIDANQEYVTIDRDYCKGVTSIVGKHHMDSFGPTLIAELRQGKTIAVNDVDHDPRTVSHRAAFAAIQTRSLLCVPSVKEGRFVALLVLHHRAPRQWAEDDIALMERISEKTWFAAERSRAEENIRRSEAHLQLALQEREQLLERERRAHAEAEATHRAQRFLSEASTVLASSLDYQTTLEQIAQLAVPELADWCTVHIIEEDDSIEQIAIAHVDRAKLEWAHKIQRKVPLTRDDPRGASFTLRTGQSDLVSEIPDEMLVQAAKDEEHLEILRQVGFSSVMSVPLRTQAKIIGVISFIAAESGRHYQQSDLQLAEELAYRASLAIENAQLYQIAQRDRTKAESANRIKDEFLAVLSHELRSPLNPILGWTRLLRTGRLNGTKTEQALETIERNARLQAQLIEDLLDVSRILRGKMSLNIAPVNLVTTIAAALETVRLAAEAKAIDLKFVTCDLRLGTETAPQQFTILGDSTRLQQIIWNLLSNAVKFTSEGGRVEVKLEYRGYGEDTAKVSGSNSQAAKPTSHPATLSPYAQITVTDTGKGINPNFLPYVFDYFRQEDGTTTRQFGGLGLGLAIVRYFTELHGGMVQADSPGQNLGATFTLRLPIAKTEQSEAGKDTNGKHGVPGFIHSKPLAHLNVLIVDDEADMRELAAYTLTQAGAQVITADSATQALTLLNQQVPNLLLCDIGMPDVDGYDLIRHIRKRRPDQGGLIPAIALTAYAGEINQQQALVAGFQLHLAKPIEPEKLVDALSAFMPTSGHPSG